MQSKVNTSQSLKSVLMKLRQRMRFHIGHHFLDIYILAVASAKYIGIQIRLRSTLEFIIEIKFIFWISYTMCLI